MAITSNQNKPPLWLTTTAILLITKLTCIDQVAADGACGSVNANGEVTCGATTVDLAQTLCGGTWGTKTCSVYEATDKWTYYFTVHGGGIPTAWQSSNLVCSSDSGEPWTNAMMIQYAADRTDYNCYVTSTDSNPVISYTGPDTAITSVIVTFATTSEGRSSVLVVNCSDSATTTYSMQEGVNGGTYYVYASGKCGEPSPGMHGPSETEVGWILTGLVLGGASFYLVGGYVYNAKVKNLSGKEAIPNKDFWVDIPSLIKDGFKFTFAKVKSLSSGGGGGESYESM